MKRREIWDTYTRYGGEELMNLGDVQRYHSPASCSWSSITQFGNAREWLRADVLSEDAIGQSHSELNCF